MNPFADKKHDFVFACSFVCGRFFVRKRKRQLLAHEQTLITHWMQKFDQGGKGRICCMCVCVYVCVCVCVFTLPRVPLGTLMAGQAEEVRPTMVQTELVKNPFLGAEAR